MIPASPIILNEHEHDLLLPVFTITPEVGTFTNRPGAEVVTKWTGKVNGKAVTGYCQTPALALKKAKEWAYWQGYNVENIDNSTRP